MEEEDQERSRSSFLQTTTAETLLLSYSSVYGRPAGASSRGTWSLACSLPKTIAHLPPPRTASPVHPSPLPLPLPPTCLPPPLLLVLLLLLHPPRLVPPRPPPSQHPLARDQIRHLHPPSPPRARATLSGAREEEAQVRRATSAAGEGVGARGGGGPPDDGVLARRV